MPEGKDRLEILERGATQVHVAGVERPRRDEHRFALQHERQEIEDVLADGVIIAARPVELALDSFEDRGRR